MSGRGRGSHVLPWVVPLLAAVAAGLFAWQAWSLRGPMVAVEFVDGAGIAPGDPVSFRGVRVGDVKAVRVSADLAHVSVEARLHRDARGLAVEGAKWWVVRPEISAGRVAGLDALLGPRYLECEPPAAGAAANYAFAGLERAPGGGRDAQTAEGGALEIVVEAPQRGTLTVDSPVVYRGVRVGSVRSLGLSATAQSVELTVVIDAEYRDLVRGNSKFWNAGGIGMDWGLIRGLSIKAGSLETMMAGAIGFATPTKMGDAVENGHHFSLAEGAKDEWLGWSPAIDVKAK